MLKQVEIIKKISLLPTNLFDEYFSSKIDILFDFKVIEETYYAFGIKYCSQIYV